MKIKECLETVNLTECYDRLKDERAWVYSLDEGIHFPYSKDMTHVTGILIDKEQFDGLGLIGSIDTSQWEKLNGLLQSHGIEAFVNPLKLFEGFLKHGTPKELKEVAWRLSIDPLELDINSDHWKELIVYANAGWNVPELMVILDGSREDKIREIQSFAQNYQRKKLKGTGWVGALLIVQKRSAMKIML